MNKKATRSSEWYLLPKQAVKDKNLTTSDKNVLSVLIYLSKAFGDSFFRGRDKLVEDLRDSNVELSSKQVSRCICKLKELGYIDYVAGFHNNKEGFGKVSEFTLTYKTNNQDKCQNNVPPNTNPNTNTNTKPNTNTKGTIKQNLNKEKVHSNTSIISTSIGETNPLFKVLVDCDDENDNLQAFLYLDEHYTNDNLEYLRKWWRNKPNWLKNLDNFITNRA